MENYYLAVDIGASSGRHILATLKNGRLEWQEIYRFKNSVYEKDGHFFWDIDYLEASILEGMKECARRQISPVSMAIDTWAVDYVLLDEKGQKLKDPYAYRDPKNEAAAVKVHEQLPFEELYQMNGIQYQPFNTLYQLKSQQPELEQAQDMLLIPDYLSYCLCGKKAWEYTNWSTTALLDEKGNLNEAILDQTGLPAHLAGPLSMPGTILGHLKPEVAAQVGFDTQVVLCASHDTASAFMASIQPGAILSSGTWSLLGTERLKPDLSLAACQANFTNEGGYAYRYRFLKNIMGLWLIQEAARNYGNVYSFAQLVELARRSDFNDVFDVNDPRFLKPDNMIAAIGQWFQERGRPVPEQPGDIARTIYLSLAQSTAAALKEMEALCGKSFETINVIGGGCQNTLLNEMIAQASGRRVIAGPVEATALGNIACQMIAQGQLESLPQARQVIAASEAITIYE